MSLLFPIHASTGLIDRGNGMIYDSDQNLTWLQDANYAFTSVYTAVNTVNNGSAATDNIFFGGQTGWDTATTWADSLVYGCYSDRRLPAISDNGDDGCNFGFNGTDCSYNVDTSGSELAYMLFVILGNVAFYYTNGSAPQTGLASASAGGVDCLNVQSSRYWSGTECAHDTDYAWYFNNSGGFQSRLNKINEFYAWAVSSGDVAVTTMPAPVLLFGLCGTQDSLNNMVWL